MAVQLELPFHVIDGGKPEPYVNYRRKIDALDLPRRNEVDQEGKVPEGEKAVVGGSK